MMPPQKPRSSRNRSLEITESDRARLRDRLIDWPIDKAASEPPIGTLWGDCLALAPHLPQNCVDLLILDPPYNLTKDFNGLKFTRCAVDDYTDWLEGVITTLKPLLKSTASIYICGDWLSSASIFTVADRQFVIRNRITWEREKGRGAKTNWKNASEDIWFCTRSDQYTFNVEAVKLRRKVLAPYKNTEGSPKDWQSTHTGNFRDTHPSNIWTDITIPFWSMPENTDHPTQKSEKLIAKLMLASSNPGDFVLDPFVGSGTSSVVAKKLGRRYLGIEQNQDYCLLTERRLELAETQPNIQGFADGVFWERNTLAAQRKIEEPGDGSVTP
jgi:site-specific DNA-methyltransferase (adenine-specific)